MRIKDETVSIKGIRTELVLALIIIDQVMQRAGKEALITSGSEETTRHSKTSLHYDGGAVDLRSWWFTHPGKVLALCKVALGNIPDIDIILENEGEANEHFHMEFQPKRIDELL